MTDYIIIASAFLSVSILIYQAGIRAENHFLNRLCFCLSLPAYVIFNIVGRIVLFPAIVLLIISKLLTLELKDSITEIINLIGD